MLSARLCRELATSRGTLVSSRGIFLSSRGLLTSSNKMMVRLPRSEVQAARILLQRSNIQSTDQLLRLSGLRLIHTSSVREKGEKQEQEDDKENEEEDDDERDRMLSALKTAVGFLAVPLLVMFIFGGFGGGSSGGGSSSGGEDRSTSALSRSRPSPGQATAEIQWADFYQNLLLKGEVQEIIIHAGVNE